MIKIRHLPTHFGELILGEHNDKLCLCDWRYRKNRISIDRRIQTALKSDFVVHSSPLLLETEKQLMAYFSGDLKTFDIPLKTIGSNFQKKVWNELKNISYGSTITYLDLAQKTADKNSLRAVAAANGANAISIIIPCHRVIGKNNNMIGYAGGINVKKKLLCLENAPIYHQGTLFDEESDVFR